MKLKAYGKINLTLDIVGKKENGYHLLDSVFQSISLCDNIEVNKSDFLSVNFSNCNVNGKDSICYKAAESFFRYTGITESAKIDVESHIPLGSGMGGGSSDAASVLVGLNRLFGTKLTNSELIDIGKKIGADIPFCIIGGTARVMGIGENISPLPSLEELPVVIIKDGIKESTAEMYRKLDEKPLSEHYTENAVKAINDRNFALLYKNISNAFNEVCNTKAEQQLLTGLGACCSGLSGSGPSVFGIFDSKDKAKTAYDFLISESHNTYLATLKKTGTEFE